MKEILVKENEAGQRLDKLLSRYLNLAPKSFLYKMLRKKNITLNGRKAAGNESVKREDRICIYLADETCAKFSSVFSAGAASKPVVPDCAPLLKEAVVYEDAHILLVNKPAGLLSQKSKDTDISANERILSYLLQNGSVTEEDLLTFRPSVCNRLDRNTSGLLIAGKTLAGLQAMSQLLKARALHKYYLCLVKGRISGVQRLDGYLKKDASANRAKILSAEKAAGNALPDGYKPICTQYRPLWSDESCTLLEVWLITGRSHQIRAHLSSIGHPILGDGKYGDEKENRILEEQYHIKGQMLHSWRMEFPEISGGFSYLSGKSFTAPPPEIFMRILRDRKALVALSHDGGPAA